MSTNNTTTDKEEFKELLRSTGREGVEDVIEYLETEGFFTAPASSTKHLCTEGGLVKHSLNTCNKKSAGKVSSSQVSCTMYAKQTFIIAP